MQTSIRGFAVGIAALTATQVAHSEDEISLFNNYGDPVAYLAIDDGLTIYMWSGSPVAYLESSNSDGYHVYGFNGHHLGWFKEGIIWGHDGYATCAIKDRIANAKIESFKGFKNFKPFKTFTEFAPFQPPLTDRFGSELCQLTLEGGAK